MKVVLVTFLFILLLLSNQNLGNDAGKKEIQAVYRRKAYADPAKNDDVEIVDHNFFRFGRSEELN